ncbi:hypothetical protein Nepgr_022761 [Nepenthes gracilis]|uniref:Uncharacterized protein n=1 Tax=Nepenthes gracilis TaxID=150966 RepID=A0AAD3T1E1_NEPGR|nr:hypothetical protein Nepgr_022761 [Nepenthes gracilis]
MALVVCWYDFICFSIVGGAVIVSLYVLWRREGSRRGEEKSLHENLLDSDGSGEAVITRAGHIRSNQLWTSCWRGLHPGWLLGTRSVSFCVLAGFLSWDVVKYGGSIFLYYTEWTFSLVMLYFAIGCVVSAHGCWLYYSKKPGSGNGERNEASRVDLEESRSTFRGKEYSSIVKLQSHNYHEDVLQRAGFWGHLMQAAYQTCAGAVILTDIVFWIIIVPFLSDVHLCLNLLMGCMHILNATFILLDTAVNSLPFPWFRLSYFVIWSSAYVIYQWVVHACGLSWWPYPFLVLSSPWAPLWYFLLAVAHLPCYGLYALIVKAKNSLFSKWFPNFFIRTN